ncbi:hypothetical protein [Bacillus weihaiensis]|uniref:hypothetical protein n=1 Tax=Bacillus weihaiensis TaxID=1547283 RepID=UPI0023529283|nr:hypothetical protein [Bacillus weihaiensis]
MKRVGVLVFLLMLVVGCSTNSTDYQYTFLGEGEKWEATFSVMGNETFKGKSYEHHYEDSFVLTYKGNIRELAPVKQLVYSYDSASSGGDAKLNFDEPLTTKSFKNSSSGNGAKIQEDEVMKVSKVVRSGRDV